MSRPDLHRPLWDVHVVWSPLTNSLCFCFLRPNKTSTSHIQGRLISFRPVPTYRRIMCHPIPSGFRNHPTQSRSISFHIDLFRPMPFFLVPLLSIMAYLVTSRHTSSRDVPSYPMSSNPVSSCPIPFHSDQSHTVPSRPLSSSPIPFRVGSSADPEHHLHPIGQFHPVSRRLHLYRKSSRYLGPLLRPSARRQ